MAKSERVKLKGVNPANMAEGGNLGTFTIYKEVGI
jgi:hypothetical protein